MAVFEHVNNNATRKKLLASNNVSFELSTECVLFELNQDEADNISLCAKKITDLKSLDMSDWKFTPQFPSAFAIYSSFIHNTLVESIR